MAVTIYKYIEEDLATLPGVRRYITARTNAAAGKAKTKLARRKGSASRSSSGRHSYIDHWVGDVDGHVALVDPDGGAMSIEFGRPAGSESGETKGVHALQGIWR